MRGIFDHFEGLNFFFERVYLLLELLTEFMVLDGLLLVEYYFQSEVTQLIADVLFLDESGISFDDLLRLLLYLFEFLVSHFDDLVLVNLHPHVEVLLEGVHHCLQLFVVLVELGMDRADVQGGL